jgi:hypothetical protein
MKRKISKAEWEALSDAQKALYVVDGDGYKMSLADDDDPDALRRARDYEKAEAKAAKAKAKELQEKIDALDATKARSVGDIATLEKSWNDKLAASEKALGDKLKAAQGHISKILLEHASSSIASAITAKPENAALILPHITPRLEVVFDSDDNPSLKVKDKDGKLSAMSFTDLQKELVGDPKFGSVVVVSKASGAGGSGGGSNGGNGGAGKPTKFADMSEAERTQLYRDDPAEFKRQSDAAKADRFSKAS